MPATIVHNKSNRWRLRIWARNLARRAVPSASVDTRIAQMLGLSDNRLKALPLDLPLAYRLTELRLGSNELTEITKDISKLKNLVRFDLADNYISSLPETLTKLSSLKELNLANNTIMQWPTNFVKLQDKVNVSSTCTSTIIPYSRCADARVYGDESF